MKSRVSLFVIILLSVLMAACAPAPTVTPAAPVSNPTAVGPADWQIYTNPAGFSIRYPASWSAEEAAQDAGAPYRTVSLKGPEGSVDLHWGTGFGGACPQGYTNLQVAEGQLQTCYSKNADGSEVWAQIGKQLTGTSFSADARTSNADMASHDLLLQILSTLSFTAP